MKSTKEQYLFIDGPAGKLEAIINADPNKDLDYTKFAIICHPHPQFSGTMHNKVVHTAARACKEVNIPSIRFNYRGVERSEGQYDNGRGEVDDLRAIIRWAKKNHDFNELILIGFSFGCFIATSAAFYDKNCDFLITIAPAVTSHDYNKIMPINNPWLVIQGLEDEIVNSQDVLDFVANQDPKPIIEKFHASHFFHGKLVELKECLVKYLNNMP